jgi:membrane protease YdiL (CAAX protease family)
VALGPAISEEVLFRGVFLAGTRKSLGTGATIVLNGIVFGLFHVPAATVFRFLPTAILGMLLTWVVLRTRSIWTGMLMHLLNNGSIVLLVASPWILERFASPETGPPIWILVPAVSFLLLGAYILESGDWTRGDP